MWWWSSPPKLLSRRVAPAYEDLLVRRGARATTHPVCKAEATQGRSQQRYVWAKRSDRDIAGRGRSIQVGHRKDESSRASHLLLAVLLLLSVAAMVWALLQLARA
jgi:hypothetical protein